MNLPVRYVDSEAGLLELVDALKHADVIALDTESDSMHCYFEKVCVLQIEANDEVWLVDTIRLRNLDPLIPVIADPERLKVLHGADYDVVCLKRDFGFNFNGLFDTMLAAQFSGRVAFGLAALCQEFFGAELDKSLTRHNWARRPLEPRYLKYLAEDVIYLRRLRELLLNDVRAQDIEEEVGLEFARVANLEWTAKLFDPDGWQKVKGSRDLDTTGRRVLHALWAMRDEAARLLDMPPFMIFNNDMLLELARRRPQSVEQLRRCVSISRRLSEEQVSRFAGAIRDAVQRSDGPPPGRRHQGSRRSDEDVRLEELLRAWRNQTAESIGRFGLALLPNHVMQEMIRLRPTNLEEMAQIPLVGRRRVEKFGTIWLSLIERSST